MCARSAKRFSASSVQRITTQSGTQRTAQSVNVPRVIIAGALENSGTSLQSIASRALKHTTLRGTQRIVSQCNAQPLDAIIREPNMFTTTSAPISASAVRKPMTSNGIESTTQTTSAKTASHFGTRKSSTSCAPLIV
jgi:hypothetical protein